MAVNERSHYNLSQLGGKLQAERSGRVPPGRRSPGCFPAKGHDSETPGGAEENRLVSPGGEREASFCVTAAEKSIIVGKIFNDEGFL